MAAIEAIETLYLEAAAASVTFDLSSSPGNTYEHLQVRMSVRTERTSNLETVGIRFNSDANNNYTTQRMYGTNSSIINGPEGSTSRAYGAGQMPTSVMHPNAMYGCAIIDVLDYRNTNKNTTVLFHSAEVGSLVSDPYHTFGSGLWDNGTTAVTTMLLYPANGSAGFSRGSHFTLFGLNSS